MKTEDKEFEVKRVNSDTNGNSRYVCHFLNLLTDNEKYIQNAVDNRYNIAIKRAHTIGGRKFHNKQFGGGIVFQAYSPEEVRELVYNTLKNIT